MKMPSSTRTAVMVSAAVVLALRASTRAMKEPEPDQERVKKDLCDHCGHSAGMHGDRIFGICSAHQYPNMCQCPGWKLWIRGKRKKAA
jgi:hypothetical protein